MSLIKSIKIEKDPDPQEGSSYKIDIYVKTEAKDESDEETNAICFLELSQIEQVNLDVEFNSSDVMVNPKTGKLICLHCLLELEGMNPAEHMKSVHNYRKIHFKCYNCKMIFVERQLLKAHKDECNPQKRQRQSFLQVMRNVDRMIEGVDDYETVSCPVCSLKLPKYCLKNHMMSEHSHTNAMLTCGMCNRNFKTKLTLTEHIKLVHNAIEDSEECDVCGQKFSSVKYLMNHKRNVHPAGDQVHRCEFCDKVYKSHLNLHQHKKYVHPPKDASVRCPHCPHKIFKSKINLRQHNNVAHSKKRPRKKKTLHE